MTDSSGTSVPDEPDAPKLNQGTSPQAEEPHVAPPVPPGQWQSAPPAGSSYQAPPPQNRQWHPHGLGKPGVIPLRPLNLGDILDGAITAIRRYPLLILGVSAIVAVISAAVNLGASLLLWPEIQKLARIEPGTLTQQQAADQMLGLLGDSSLMLGVTLVITLLTQTVLSGFLTVVMGNAVLGKPVTFRDAIAELKPRILPLLGLTVLYTLAVLAGALLCLIGALPVYVYFSLASPALILERARVGQAFTRSRQLVRGSFWRVFGILLLTAVIAGTISAIISIPFSLGGGGLSALLQPGTVVPSTGQLVVQAVGSVVAQTIVTPFVALVTVVLYIDQRMRKEGMDIELARAAGVVPPQSW